MHVYHHIFLAFILQFVARIFADLTVDQEDALARRVMQPDVTTTSLLKSYVFINMKNHVDHFILLIFVDYNFFAHF